MCRWITNRSLQVFFPAVVLLGVLGSDPASAQLCTGRQTFANVCGEGETAQEAVADWEETVRSRCYALCARQRCRDDDRRCTMTSHQVSPRQPARRPEDPDRPPDAPAFQVCQDAFCKCGCVACSGRKRVPLREFEATSDSSSDAAGRAEEQAKAWCDDNECSRYSCQAPRTCKTRSALSRGRPVITRAGDRQWRAVYRLQSCNCVCESG